MASLADNLGQAFANEAMITLSSNDVPRSQDEAERVRDEAVKSIGSIKAWKIGASIAAVRKDLGLSRQFFSPICSSCVFEDGAELNGFQTRLQGVESEYGFELARDLTSSDAERNDDDLAKLFAFVRPAIEIPGTRFASLGHYGGFGLVADFGAMGGLVLGPACALNGLSSLDRALVQLSFGQKQVASGSAEIIEGGAMGPLRAFLRQALKAGYSLKEGQTIVTGSCTGYLKAPLNERVRATFDALNVSVSLTFIS